MKGDALELKNQEFLGKAILCWKTGISNNKAAFIQHKAYSCLYWIVRINTLLSHKKGIKIFFCLLLNTNTKLRHLENRMDL